MKTLRLASIIITLAYLGFVSPNTSLAGHTSFHVGVGYHNPHYHTGLHYSQYGRWPGHHYWGRHCYPRAYYWGIDYWPVEVVNYPVVVERPTVIVKEPVVVNVSSNPKVDDETFADIRNKKSELLKKLTIGDKASRMSAIAELGGFTFDDTVREKLSEIILSDPDSQVRKEVAKSFGKIKNEKVLSVLEKVRVSDADIEVRKEADKSINQIKGN